METVPQPIISVASATVRASSTSQRIIAAGIVIAFCYWASSVIVTLLISMLMAYFLDPLVSYLERLHIPRSLGSLIIVLLVIGFFAVIGWTLILRMDQFSADWPNLREPIQKMTSTIERRVEGIENSVATLGPQPEANAKQPIQVVREESHAFRNVIVSRLASFYSVILGATFIPFLLFFMLAAKRQVWHATMQLFPSSERTEVRDTLNDVSDVLRSYVVGTAMVGLVLVIASWLFFWSLGLDFAFLTALVSGILNLVPYLGVVMSWAPVTLVALRKYHTISPFLGIYAMLGIFHLIAANVLFPAMVGRRVHLNALAVTVALLFWGFLWGGIGLILAIPITATIKVICDHTSGCEPIGRWLGAS
jgi:predicted PurR-regulated permease PerM